MIAIAISPIITPTPSIMIAFISTNIGKKRKGTNWLPYLLPDFSIYA